MCVCMYYICVYILCVCVFVYNTSHIKPWSCCHTHCTVCVFLTTRWQQRLTVKRAAFRPPNYFIGHLLLDIFINVWNALCIVATMYYLMHRVQLKWVKLDSCCLERTSTSVFFLFTLLCSCLCCLVLGVGVGGGCYRMWNQFPAVDTEILVPGGKGFIVMLNQPSTPRSHFISNTTNLHLFALFFYYYCFQT